MPDRPLLRGSRDEPLRILVTNDDGINAPGLEVLERVARTLSPEVWVVAPETNQSGASHSLTLRRPLRLRRIKPRRYAIDGTPTDCVLLAIQTILKEASFDLVLSGINQGGNLGEDVGYSGTVAAAMEATLFNVPAFALSQEYKGGQPVRWETAERFAPDLISRLLTKDWANDTFINVNFPSRPPDDVKGYRVATQGKRKLGDELFERIDPRGEPYVWIGVLREEANAPEGTDLDAVAKGYVAITPIHMDMTHRPSLTKLLEALA